jgi:hypothetical protein
MLDSQIQPKLGLIPNDGCRPFLKLELPAAALTAPPPAVDWFSKLTVPLGMYGNDHPCRGRRRCPMCWHVRRHGTRRREPDGMAQSTE